MRGAASESAAASVSHNAAAPIELNDLCRTKLKLPYQTYSDAVLLPDLFHQLGSAHEWSGVWIRPQSVENGTAVSIWNGSAGNFGFGTALIQTPNFS